jgi:hypothetical protein
MSFRKGRTYRNDLNTQVTVQGANRPKSTMHILRSLEYKHSNIEITEW